MALGWGQDNYDGGWVNDPVAVASCAKANGFLEWGATEAASLSEAELPKDFMFCELERKILGKPIDPKDQGSYGFCTGFGTANAAERTLIAQMVAGESWEYKKLASEVIYSGGRYDAGYSWAGDGSTGAACAAFVKAKGAPPRAKYGDVDLNTYQADAARTWARRGLPSAVLEAAKQFPVQEVAKITNWQDAKKALVQGHCILVCSTFGFKQTRNANGIAEASGTWRHAMCIQGWALIEGEDCGSIVNSWGEYFKGPQGPYSPGNHCFYARAKVVDAMLRQNDSYALIGVKGATLNRKLLKWF